MVDCCKKILSYVEGMSYENFIDDDYETLWKIIEEELPGQFEFLERLNKDFTS